MIDTFQGPQINKGQFDKILSYIEIGKKEGAVVSYGGKRWGSKGYYIEPTVFTNCHNQMRIMREEIFGPVVAIAKFKTIEEAIDIANDSDYGLAGSVYTTNLDTAITVTNEVKTGTMWVSNRNIYLYFFLKDWHSILGEKEDERILPSALQVILTV